MYILSNRNSYDILVFSNTDSVAYAEWIPNSDYMLLAQYNFGLGLYKIEEGARRVSLIKMYNDTFFSK